MARNTKVVVLPLLIFCLVMGTSCSKREPEVETRELTKYELYDQEKDIIPENFTDDWKSREFAYCGESIRLLGKKISDPGFQENTK